jgi:hypothetical protein
MTITTSRKGSVILHAPSGGILKLCVPRNLCGELEVFEQGDCVAMIDDRALEAPELCFIKQVFSLEGVFVREGDPILEVSIP